MKKLAEIIHTMTCKKKHAGSWTEIRNMESCFWYLEEQLENCWEEPDHKEGLKLAEVLMRSSFEDPRKNVEEKDTKKMSKHMFSLLEAIGKIDYIKNLFPKETRFIIEDLVSKILEPRPL